MIFPVSGLPFSFFVRLCVYVCWREKENCMQWWGLETFEQLPDKKKNEKIAVLIWIGPTGGVGHFPPAAEAICLSIKYLFSLFYIEHVYHCSYFSLCSFVMLFCLIRPCSHLVAFSFFFFHRNNKGRNYFLYIFFFCKCLNQTLLSVNHQTGSER